MRSVDEIEKKLEEVYKKRDLLNNHSQQENLQNMIKFSNIEISLLEWILNEK